MNSEEMDKNLDRLIECSRFYFYDKKENEMLDILLDMQKKIRNHKINKIMKGGEYDEEE